MLKKIGGYTESLEGACVKMKDAAFPVPFKSGLEYSSPARGTWNIVHTGMLIPEAHEIFVCAGSCLRGVVLTAAEMNAMDRFSTVEVKENNLLDGDLEELLIEGVSDVVEKLEKRPPALLVYTSCVHHFTGCDWNVMFSALRERFPDIDIIDCYMNPTLRKSGLTPDQIMRKQLYGLLKPRKINENSVAIIGNDLPTLKNSELYELLIRSGKRIHEITSCKSYAEYQEMAEAGLYVSCYPAAKAGGDALAKRLGGTHIYLPYSWDYAEIRVSLEKLGEYMNKEAVFSEEEYCEKTELCEKALKEAKELVGNIKIAIDYTFCPRPTSVAKVMLEHGFNVKRIYLDSFTGEEKDDYEFLKNNYPDLELYATVNTGSRFMASKAEGVDGTWLAIGQKAAYFLGTNRFVNVVEGGGMFGYEAVTDTMELLKDAYLNEKNMRALVQLKGQGCGCCSCG